MSQLTISACLAGVLAVVLVAPVRAAAGDEPNGQGPAGHDELVAQLGDPSFQNRESASDQLIDLGAEAYAALLRGASHSDPEIRFRCKRILAVIEHETRERLYKEFLAGSSVGKPFGGWERFQGVVGDDRQSRQLFVEMHRSEWDLLETLLGDPKLVPEKFSQRCGYLRQASQTFRQQLPLGSVATIVFLAAQEDLELSEAAGSNVYTFCYQSSFRTAIGAGPNKENLRKLLGKWVANNSGISTAYQGLMLAMRHDLKEGLAAAKKVLAEPGMPHHYKQFAMLAVAKLGTRDDIPLLKKFLDDPAACGAMTVAKGNERIVLQTQLRDVALAGVIHLSGQDIKQFGFAHAQINSQMLYNVNTLGFEEEKLRDESRKKWDDFLKHGPQDDATEETPADS